NVKSNQVQTFSLMSTVTQEEDNDENDFKLIDPYQPSPEVNIKALINGARIIPSLSEPNDPKINDIWIDLADKNVKVWDGSAWSGDIKIEQIEKELKNHEEYMKEFEEQLNEELERAQKELEEAMQQVEEEMRRIEEEVLPEIERAVDEAYIPHSEFPPEEVPTSGLWMDTSQDPPRLMRWDSKLADYVPLAPTEQEIQELMEKMREEAKTESIRYSKLDILKARKELTQRIQDEMQKVTQDIQELLEIKDELIEVANNIDELLDEYDGKFTDFQQTIDELSGLVTTSIQDIERIDNTVEAHSSLISQNAKAIELKLDSVIYERDKADILTSIERNESAISALADSIELMVTKEEYRTDMEGIDEFISSTNATLQLHANALEAKAERSELANYVDKQTYTNQIGELNVAIDGISGRVEKTEADI